MCFGLTFLEIVHPTPVMLGFVDNVGVPEFA
jgi:hypothetical protein